MNLFYTFGNDKNRRIKKRIFHKEGHLWSLPVEIFGFFHFWRKVPIDYCLTWKIYQKNSLKLVKKTPKVTIRNFDVFPAGIEFPSTGFAKYHKWLNDGIHFSAIGVLVGLTEGGYDLQGFHGSDLVNSAGVVASTEKGQLNQVSPVQTWIKI